MLTLLLRTRLRPYRRPLTAVVVLQLIGTIASLYLPSLNAQIIDDLNRRIHDDERVDMAMTVSADGLMFVRVR